jgi:uncharacterized protein (DUF3084 family)
MQLSKHIEQLNFEKDKKIISLKIIEEKHKNIISDNDNIINKLNEEIINLEVIEKNHKNIISDNDNIINKLNEEIINLKVIEEKHKNIINININNLKKLNSEKDKEINNLKQFIQDYNIKKEFKLNGKSSLCCLICFNNWGIHTSKCKHIVQSD